VSLSIANHILMQICWAYKQVKTRKNNKKTSWVGLYLS